MKSSTAKRKIAKLKRDEKFQTAYFTGDKSAIAEMKYLMVEAYPKPKNVLL